MIRKLKIHNFKIHRDTELDLGNLTIFTGANDTGKSSVFHALVMLRGSLINMNNSSELSLYGDSFKIATSLTELINWDIPYNCSPHTLGIEMVDDVHGCYAFAYNYGIKYSRVLRAVEGTQTYCLDDLVGKISLFDDRFQYLSAYSVGPQTYYRESVEVDKNGQLLTGQGSVEYTVSYLRKHSKDRLKILALSHFCETKDTLQSQVDVWLGDISNGVGISIEQNEASQELYFSYSLDSKGNGRRSSAINASFGLSYALSVIVAILTAEKGSLIIIENPEAHLHPAGQASLMKLISLAANNGVQVILETHSDHIVNGALVAAKTKLLELDKLSLYHFTRNPQTLASEAIKIKIGEDCRIKNSPRGFFDQMSKDLDILFDLE